MSAMLELLPYKNDCVMITIAMFVIVIGYTATSKYLTCCLRNSRNKIISFDHDGITTKLINDTDSCCTVLNEFLLSNPKIIGLDCEWVGNNKVSLLQIANEECIILIRLHKLSSIPIELIRLLGNVEIIKCGVGIKNDIKKLESHYNIETVGCIELNKLYQQINDDMIQNMGLNKLYKVLFNKNMKYKQEFITRSNWESEILSDKQLHYAADDALVGYQIFIQLMQSYLIKTNNNKHDNIDYLELLYGLIDNFQCKSIITKSTDTCNHSKMNERNRLRSGVLNNVGKRTLFDNCKILQPDGSLLGYCSKFALKWHLNEGIAMKIDETTIKLKFTKPVKVQIFDEYIRTESPNLCFICGNIHNLRKFSVFPFGYSRFIEEEYYDRSCFNHDNILLCLLCNKKAQKMEVEFKKLLCDKYKNVTHFEIPTKLWYAIKCAKTLKRDERRKRIPIYKQIELLHEVLTYFGLKYKVIYDINQQKQCLEELIVYGFLKRNNIKIDKIFTLCLSYYYNKNDIPLDQLIKIEDNEEKNEYIMQKHIDELTDFNQKQQLKLHCKELVQQFDGKELEFIELWRNNFIKTMKPKFLPKNW